MPTQIKNIFAANDLIVHYRLRKDGVYEATFHRQGIDIEVSSKDLTKLKQKFIEKLNNYDGSSKRRKRNRNEQRAYGQKRSQAQNTYYANDEESIAVYRF